MVNCPPGFLCLNTQILIIYIILISLLIYYLFNKTNSIGNYIGNNIGNNIDNKLSSNIKLPVQENPKILELERKIKQQNNKINSLYPNKSYNNTIYDSNDLLTTSTYITKPNIPINILTRPVSQFYTQVGVLYSICNSNIKPHILPLYGKAIYRGSNKWSYYTKTDDYHTIKIPIYSDGRKCTGDYGCDNLNNGDLVNVSPYPYKFKVELYDLQYPQYLPYN